MIHVEACNQNLVRLWDWADSSLGCFCNTEACFEILACEEFPPFGGEAGGGGHKGASNPSSKTSFFPFAVKNYRKGPLKDEHEAAKCVSMRGKQRRRERRREQTKIALRYISICMVQEGRIFQSPLYHFQYH